jgi:hypothetical protein
LIGIAPRSEWFAVVALSRDAGDLRTTPADFHLGRSALALRWRLRIKHRIRKHRRYARTRKLFCATLKLIRYFGAKASDISKIFYGYRQIK